MTTDNAAEGTPITIADVLPQAWNVKIEAALGQYCSPGSGATDCLRDAMRYSLLAPGKRLRPMLVLMGCEATGGDIDSALPAAAAVEMVHAYSLVHDDLPAMDDDDLRRGRETCHIAFDQATAILAGDALLALAFETLARHLPIECAADAVCVLATAAGPEQLVGGQADDLEAETGGARTVDRLEYIHRRKTGALIIASLRLGAIVAGADSDALDHLQQYGDALGLAFQVTDDLLDATATDQQMGKRTGKDIDRGKLTYPGLIGINASFDRARSLTTQAAESAALLGQPGHRLAKLAQYVFQRTH
ncbi:MAG: polyprenyl synthetase family protein [Planctomycetota bacterium]